MCNGKIHRNLDTKDPLSQDYIRVLESIILQGRNEGESEECFFGHSSSLVTVIGIGS